MDQVHPLGANGGRDYWQAMTEAVADLPLHAGPVSQGRHEYQRSLEERLEVGDIANALHGLRVKLLKSLWHMTANDGQGYARHSSLQEGEDRRQQVFQGINIRSVPKASNEEQPATPLATWPPADA